jgi:hypothetical protein
MVKFLRLLEEARVGFGDLSLEQKRPLRNLTEFEWGSLEKCRPFVFHFSESDPFDTTMKSDTDDNIKKIDAPFEIFSIEILGERKFLATLTEEDETPVYSIDCIVFIETSVSDFDCIGLGVFPDGTKTLFSLPFDFVKTTLDRVLKRISTGKLGLETSNINAVLGTGKSKRRVSIRKIVHVRDSLGTSNSDSNSRDRIDWSHRFEVRGHWRKTDLLGKDRNGDYCVHGYTWVTHHTRGPEHLPLIKKTRLVNPNISQKHVTL